MVNPKSSCGHTVCGYCADRFSAQQGSLNKCYMCKKIRKSFAEQMLEKIEVKCKGCGTNVFLDQVEAHVKGCTEIEVQCTLSKEIMRRREKEADKETRAQEDIVCACGIRFKRETTNIHSARQDSTV